MKSNCKNCGNNDYKDGKCSYCGTDYGLTGDLVQDEWLIALRRKRVMEEDGYVFNIMNHQLRASDSVSGNIFFSPNAHKITYAIHQVWEWYCDLKYMPEELKFKPIPEDEYITKISFN